MNDNLNLLISYVCKNLELHKIVLRVPHGMNNPGWGNWKYYLQDDIQELVKSATPLYIRNHIYKIVHIEEVFAIVGDIDYSTLKDELKHTKEELSKANSLILKMKNNTKEWRL